jgi:hypothetical protein
MTSLFKNLPWGHKKYYNQKNLNVNEVYNKLLQNMVTLSLVMHKKWLKTISWNKQNNLEQHFVDSMKRNYKHKTNVEYETKWENI